MTLSIGVVSGLIITGIVVFVGVAIMIFSFFRKIDQGKALIVNTMRSEPVVTFTGKVVLPVIHRAEVMDISLKTIEIDRHGREGLICRDNIRADIKVTFFVRVNKTAADVLKVAQAIGCARASDQKTLEELFSAKFSEALKTVGKQLDLEDLYKERDSFRDKIIQVIGKDLNGYVLEDAAIDYLEQTSLSVLDPDNILDAQGIKKIKELTSIQHVKTNEYENQEKMKIEQQNVTTQETLAELERRGADADARKEREIKNLRDREEAEMKTVEEQERLRAEQARIAADEQIEILAQNKLREVEVAEQNRLRVVSVEAERVKLATEQEVITREREIELQRIAKEKALEEERREIANVIRERVVVEKTVAEEEEKTKELRMVSEADREKQVLILHAEAEAEKTFVTDIKAAQASQEAAKFRAQEQLTLAEAERESADKQAAAKIRLAEGMQAEAAAEGLAEVRVKEANATAIIKEGEAEAKVLQDRMQAEAVGVEQKGLAHVRVKEAQADIVEKEGIAEARATQEKLQAESVGIEAKGLAQARVDEAHAEAVEKQGLADAHALQERLTAEATGLSEKFKALDTLTESGRQHEEFRMRLDKQVEIEQARLASQQVISANQAEILSAAFKEANIDIVGGESTFIDRVINATSMAKTVDSFVDKSDVSQQVFKGYLEDDANLVEDIKNLIQKASLSTQDIQNLSLSAFLAKLMAVGDAEQKSKLSNFISGLSNKASNNYD